MEKILIGGALIIVCSILLLVLLNSYLPKWFCDKLGWHLEPKEKSFDGCSLEGICPRCGKHVLQNSQGNWF